MDYIGLYWTILDYIGLYWTILDLTGPKFEKGDRHSDRQTLTQTDRLSD